MISGSFPHDRTGEHNQIPDESKEQKQTEDLAGIQAHHHEQLPRSLDEYQTKFRDDHEDHEGSVDHTTSGRVGRES